MTNWKNQHYTAGPPTDDPEILEPFLKATWKTPMHLKCMHQQVAGVKKHVSVCLVTRVAEAIFLFLALALLTAWLSHPLIAILQSLEARARKARREERLLR